MNTFHTKNTLILFCLFLAFSLSGQTQNKSGNFRGYTHSGVSVGGYFHHADTTGIYYATTKSALKDLRQLERMPLQDTHNIKIRRKGSVVRGALFGFLAGTVTGTMVGSTIASNEDYSDAGILEGVTQGFGTVAGGVIGALSGALAGTITGALIGNGKKRFLLRGKVSRLKAQERKLKKFAYRDR